MDGNSTPTVRNHSTQEVPLESDKKGHPTVIMSEDEKENNSRSCEDIAIFYSFEQKRSFQGTGDTSTTVNVPESRQADASGVTQLYNPGQEKPVVNHKRTSFRRSIFSRINPSSPTVTPQQSATTNTAAANFTIRACGKLEPTNNDGSSERSSSTASITTWITATKNFVLSTNWNRDFPTEEKGFLRSCGDRRSAAKASIPQTAAQADIRRFLLTPGGMNKNTQCQVMRIKKGFLFPKVYYVFSLEGTNETVLVARRHRRSSGAASFHIYAADSVESLADELKPVARLHANIMGTEYSLVADNDDFHAEQDGIEYPSRTHELAAMVYAPSTMGKRGPRKLTVVIPKLVGSGESAWDLVPASTPAGSLISRYQAMSAGRVSQCNTCVILPNRPPRWNQKRGAFCLDFKGRITRPSVKNLQLASEDDLDRTLLQFGRVAPDGFVLDYAFPMAPLQAFGVALTALDPKFGWE